MKNTHILRVGLEGGQVIEFGFDGGDRAEKVQTYIADALMGKIDGAPVHIEDDMGRLATISVGRIAYAVAIDIEAEVAGMVAHRMLAEATQQRVIAGAKPSSLVVPRPVMFDPNGRPMNGAGH